MPCATAFTFIFSNYLFFSNTKNLNMLYYSRHAPCLLHQTKEPDLLSWGNRHASCLGASNISNAVMLTHSYEGCVSSQWKKTQLKTVRLMTETQIKSVLVGGHPLLLFSCHSWIPNSRGRFSKLWRLSVFLSLVEPLLFVSFYGN